MSRKVQVLNCAELAETVAELAEALGDKGGGTRLSYPTKNTSG